MRVSDFKESLRLWKASPGVGTRPDDTRDNLARYLKRNPGFSMVAVSKSKIVGTLLAGHDGRRGLLAHLAVAEEYRRLGLGRKLAEGALRKLEKAGIHRSYAMVFKGNRSGARFWKKTGWIDRSDLSLFVSRFKPQRKPSR